MKKLFFVFTVLLLAIGCDQLDSGRGGFNRPVPPFPVPEPRPSVVGSDTVAGQPEPEEKPVRISGTVFYTSSYCGGAAPSGEATENLVVQQPYAGKMLVFYGTPSGEKRVVRTDAAGRYSVSLPDGEYLLKPGKRKAEPGYSYDVNCAAWLNTIFLTVQIDRDETERDFVVHLDCDPCDPSIRSRP